MWRDPRYRVNSPGLNIAPFALEKLEAVAGDTIWDFGAGEGKAFDYFWSQKVEAGGIDIVSLRPDIWEACLWSLGPQFKPATFVFSADVLEHLPMDKVDAVIENIRRLSTKGAFVTVAEVDDVHGARIGETLHLTIKPPSWWDLRFRQQFSRIEQGQGDREWRYWFHLQP